MKSPLHLPSSELAILQVLWETGGSTTRKIAERLYERVKTSEYYTVQKLLERLEEEIGVAAGGTDADQRFTLRTVRCIGCCALAPAMRIDGITFGKAKLNQVSRILERFE